MKKTSLTKTSLTNDMSSSKSRHKLFVKKRDGSMVPVSYDSITKRLTDLCDLEPPLDNCIEPLKLTETVIKRIKNGISTSEIDILIADVCSSMIEHPDYNNLAGRLVISNHHRDILANTGILFSEICSVLYANKNKMGHNAPLISDEFYHLVLNNKKEVDSIIDLQRDYLIDFMGFKTLQKSYLLRTLKDVGNGVFSEYVVECPQHCFLRYALDTHKTDFKKVRETYNLHSLKYFTPATPTLFNSGTPRPQKFSCFILNAADSIEGIFKCISDTAKISKWAGGIGISISDIRSNGSYIAGTAGRSDGIVPMLKVFNDTARYINQGGRRNGSFAVYLEPWHADIFEFLECKLNTGAEEVRAKDLFYGLWIPDLFMTRLEKALKDEPDLEWSLMCPSECAGLTECHGPEFEEKYLGYEAKGLFKRRVKILDLWTRIINTQIETGQPYMLYKDSINLKSNQKNLGTVKSSNLCTEICEYNTPEKYACCCLSSLILPTYVESHSGIPLFDYQKLYEVVRIIVRNLDITIDNNFYPVPETSVSNMSERPLGIGVQGLADVFFKLRIPFDSKEASIVNKKIFETMYFAALTESNIIASEKGTYPSYNGSPASKGLLQFDMWPSNDNHSIDDSMWNWTELRVKIAEFGLRNSLLIALMPTASTAQIYGTCVECFEPLSSNVYSRRVLSGEYIVWNKYLTNDLISLGLWSKSMANRLKKYKGSIQHIKGIPQEIKDIYKTCWDLKQRVIIDMAADRAIFVDQSQSMNLFFEKPSYQNLTSAHLYGFKKGLKTGSYYIRSKPATSAEQFTVEDDDEVDEEIIKVSDNEFNKMSYSVKSVLKNDEACDMCAS